MPRRPSLRTARDRGRRLLRRLGIRTLRLEFDDVVEAARRWTGLSDFGDATYLFGAVDAYVRSYDRDTPVPPEWIRSTRRHLAHLLSVRLRIEDFIARRPEVLETPVAAPVFIVSLPRCSSTFFHRLLAADPAARAPRLWEMTEPVPPPEEATYATDPRIARLEPFFDERVTSHDHQKLHYVSPALPDECVALLANEGYFPVAASDPRAPTYGRWVDEHGVLPAYEGHRRQLQLLQHRFRRDWWVLKSPIHLEHLDAITTVYPDARIVWLHRDPVRASASLAKLAWTSERNDGFAPITRGAMGGRVLGFVARRLRIGMEARARLEARGVLFADVHFDDVMEDPVGEARRVYASFGLPFSTAAGEAMSAYAADNPRHKHGAYTYALEDYGLSEHDVRAVTAAYDAAYGR